MGTEDIVLDSRAFKHVKTRLFTPVSIYTCGDAYLRIGPPELIQRELSVHKNLVSFGFPVANIQGEGYLDDRYYYIEESLGEEIIGRSFCEDFKANAVISEKWFDTFLGIAERFVAAQTATIGKPHFMSRDFFQGIHLDILFHEAPHLREIATATTQKIKKRLTDFPPVFSQ